MAYFEFINHLKMLDELIRVQKTGNAMQLAAALHLSRSTIFNYFDIIRSKGGDIQYSRPKRSYYYKNKFELNF